ncbi:MAG: DUF4446 family protein [Paenibacillaceae bacterium]
MGNIDQDIVVIACIGVIVLFIILITVNIMLWRKVNSIKRKYDAMIGHTGVANLEEIITELQRKMSITLTNHSEHEHTIQQMKIKISEMKGNVSMQRYNAFNETGSDQSFSIAFVDDHLDGLVFTVIHGREESYSYGKPVIKGESKYPLSPEERLVINLAQSKSPNHV